MGFDCIALGCPDLRELSLKWCIGIDRPRGAMPIDYSWPFDLGIQHYPSDGAASPLDVKNALDQPRNLQTSR
ncbi:hypothetical protein E2562_011637 [Oryza meyeriana var. granulata]|uniref:Uncharacterized protein n=1 Tax=Oryza meyeriana var. granulata TaxID=110450 RepID=A0A6G1DW04_9ORYZ|nr:hypothetical protein E2562_011637 [Oryza meyeriana var. granulata]